MTQSVIIPMLPGSKLDPSVPVPIQSMVRADEWNVFCSRIDHIVTSAQGRPCWYVLGMFVTFFLGGFVGFFLPMEGAMIFSPVVCFGSMVVGFGLLVTHRARLERAIDKVCHQFSDEHPLVTVRCNFAMGQLEVAVVDGEGDPTSASASTTASGTDNNDWFTIPTVEAKPIDAKPEKAKPIEAKPIDVPSGRTANQPNA